MLLSPHASGCCFFAAQIAPRSRFIVPQASEEYNSGFHKTLQSRTAREYVFDKARYVYTFENRCREDIGIVLGGDATKIILNTEGTVGEISDDLKALLRFMDRQQAGAG